jgi:uncharacterized protein
MSSITKKEMEVLASPSFEEIINRQLDNPARRSMLKGGAGVATLGFMGLSNLVMDEALANGSFKTARVGFESTGFSTADAVTVAEGYDFQVLYKLGDPIAKGVANYANDGSDGLTNPFEFEFRAGDHHDGMYFFGLGANGRWDEEASERGLLCINHEAITPLFLHPNGPSGAPRNPVQALKEMHLHGVSVIEVVRGKGGRYTVVQDSKFNRRITTLTPMQINGPIRGSDFAKTKYSPDGTMTRGTINNCASGYTPWGTYLTCEENWNGYFRNLNPGYVGIPANDAASHRRYSIADNATGRELWATADETGYAGELFSRWNAKPLTSAATRAAGATDYRNAPFTYGYNVEIDPFSPSSTPRKRTAMGRFAHEGAWVGPVTEGQPVVFYMGCDSRYEYIYKFVSTAKWNRRDINGGLAAGDKYLDNGTLYVARYNDDFSGEWLRLADVAKGTLITPRRPGSLAPAAAQSYAVESELDQYVNTRILADFIGGTPMDRPEWGAVNPRNGDVYMTLTNNTSRTDINNLNAANPRAYRDNEASATSSYGNVNGHIIRWKEAAQNPAATKFIWDIYLFGAESDDLNKPSVNVSGLTPDNFLSSPDGLWFSEKTGILYIQTDDGAFTDTTNCMLLAVVPGDVGDGKMVNVVNTSRDGLSTRTVTTRVGNAGVVRRLLVGPKDSEITGITESFDGKALFVNIQHPGEDSPSLSAPTSSWPYALGNNQFGNPGGGTEPTASNRPRSATIVITKKNGGVIGV